MAPKNEKQFAKMKTKKKQVKLKVVAKRKQRNTSHQPAKQSSKQCFSSPHHPSDSL